ncbi:LysR family transcriptional regulator [Paraburkholderia phenazinium]|jgi:DNA-binding transcriptional LysR family regulator|uniref:DNA-binding transcriptional regulator, LysR family n=1 Tax=Paraburkholderia phenazinium TaxID=60549 RepID=A0A1G7U3I7_9BURK|nr:LysR family transcriptional regulator [Paraburkholderia phenazinium]SDG41619.1 DNA-binding transcriptional regulator, LysR family [Paraburkholderia phenazinium]
MRTGVPAGPQSDGNNNATTTEARLELRHLRYFRAVAEELSFTRAADRLCIAQPPLSQQIRQLEDDLGVQLIERTERPLRLTDAGKHFLRRSTEILSSVQSAVDEVRRVGRGMTGTLSIGFAGSAMYNFLPDIVNAYRDLYPEIALTFDEMLAGQIEEALEARRIDVGFSRPGIDAPDKVQQRLLLEEPLVVAVSERHPLSARSSVPVQALNEQDAILYPRYPKPSLTDLVLEQLERAAVRLNLVQEAGNLQTAMGLVAAGVGITFVPASVAQHRRSGVRFLPVDPQILFSPMTVVWLKDSTSAALRNFLAIVENHSASIA